MRKSCKVYLLERKVHTISISERFHVSQFMAAVGKSAQVVQHMPLKSNLR